MDEELTRFSISNESIKDAQGNLDLSILSKWKSMVGEMTKALESSVNSIVKVTTKIDSAGNAITHFDVPRKMSDIAQASLSRTLGHAEYKYGLPQGAFIDPNTGSPATNAEQYRRIYFNKSFYGADAQRELKRAVEATGGTVERNPSKQFKDRYRIGFSVSEREYAETLQRFDNNELKARESLTGKFVRSNLAVASKFSSDANARTKEKEDEKEKTKLEKEKTSSFKKGLGTVTAILSAITVVANITRRLLTAVLDRTSQMQKDAVTAKSLGISYGSMRQYNATEIGMGMQQGTFTGAIGSLQSAFGDITHLDEKALGELAKVMGGGVLGAIQTGLGQNDPQALMESILNAYFERGQKGINSIGQRVGQYQAERELATSLEKAGLKEIAEILRMMFYQQDTGINKGSIRADGQNSFKDFMSVITTYTMGNTRFDMKQAQELTEVINTLKARLQDLSDSISVIVLQKFARIINWLDNWDFGKSQTERAVDISKRISNSSEFVSSSKERLAFASNVLNTTLKDSGIKITSPFKTPAVEYEKNGVRVMESFDIQTPADLAMFFTAMEGSSNLGYADLPENLKALYDQYNRVLQLPRKGKQVASASRTALQAKKDIEYGERNMIRGQFDKSRATEAGFTIEAQTHYSRGSNVGTYLPEIGTGSAYIGDLGSSFYDFINKIHFQRESGAGNITLQDLISFGNINLLKKFASLRNWDIKGRNFEEYSRNLLAEYMKFTENETDIANVGNAEKTVRKVVEGAVKGNYVKFFKKKIPDFEKLFYGSKREAIDKNIGEDISSLLKLSDFMASEEVKNILPANYRGTVSISEYDEKTRTQTIRLEYKNLDTGETKVISRDVLSEGGDQMTVSLNNGSAN